MKRILVVDDDVSILEGFKLLLKNKGYEVNTAQNGKIAYDLVKTNQYDVIILDQILPDIHAFELIKNLKNLENTSSSEIFLLTGYITKKTFASSKKSGIKKCLIKPIEFDTLLSEIK